VLAFGVLVTPALAGCANQDGGEGNTGSGGGSTSSSETVHESVDQNIQDKLADRPAAGTAEYTKLYVDPLIIPYVAGQNHGEVVTELQKSVSLFLEEGYANAPQTTAQLESWQSATSKSIDDLVSELNLSYYNEGAGTAWFGPNSDNNAYRNMVLTNYASTHNDRVSAMILGNAPAHAEIVDVVPGIQSDTDIEILGVSTAVMQDSDGNPVGSDGGKLGISYDLVAKDTNGDGKLDQWVWVGPGPAN
jgi:hypothetical protein